jgi:hypothetical protein
MRQSLDRFILGLPVLFLKQYPYAWIVFVALWPRSPSMALVFLAVVVIGILALRWQSAAWISQMRFEHGGGDAKFYVDQPPIPWRMAVRKIALLVAGAILLALLLQGQLGLSFWQYFIMIVGFALFYQDTRFFGAPETYIVTASGIGLHFVPGHLDYRLFLQFKEISRIERTIYQPRSDTDIFARTREEQQEGLLLIPKDSRGFSRRINKLFIAPGNLEKFVEQLPFGYGKSY